MAYSKYKAYYNGSLVKVPGHILYMSIPESGSSCSVSDGGNILLANGDVLHINEEYGEIEAEYAAGCYGIELTLESGHTFISYLLNENNGYAQESGYGVFFDLGWEYDGGNVLKIYDTNGLDYEEDFDYCFEEDYVAKMQGVTLIAVLVIDSGDWQLTTEPRYLGNSITLNSGEEIYVSGPCQNDAMGVYFTRSSGNGCFAYYKRNDELLNHTSNFWFGTPVCFPQEGDYIIIYDYGPNDDYQEAIDFSEDYTEDNVSDYLAMLCSIWYNGSDGRWYINEDYS